MSGRAVEQTQRGPRGACVSRAEVIAATGRQATRWHPVCVAPVPTARFPPKNTETFRLTFI